MSTKKPSGALDLGVLQSELQQAARNLKSSTSTLLRANEAQIKAEAEYDVAKKALDAGVQQLRAATKV